MKTELSRREGDLTFKARGEESIERQTGCTFFCSASMYRRDEKKCDANGISRIKNGGLYKAFEMTRKKNIKLGKSGTRNKQQMQAVKDNSRGIFKE